MSLKTAELLRFARNDVVSGMLPLRPFGNTGLQVTALAVGLAPLGSMPETFGYEVSVDQALAT
ncbi:MAG: hypothetical protein HYU65_07110, partial [Armatimonadetes bacterium]|nr:hypothetical protein [Armatimonadota bacterium]